MNVRKRQRGIYTDEILIITDGIFVGDLKLFCILSTDYLLVKNIF